MSNSTVNLLLVSDLHLDMGRYDLSSHMTRLMACGQRVDAVVLLGDIIEAAGGSPIAYASSQVPTNIPAIFIPGNHDFYGGRFGNIINRWYAQARGSHVQVLIDAQTVVSNPSGGEVVLLGTPLWSNLASFGPLAEAELRRTVHRQVADFSCMFASNGSAWTVGKMLDQFDLAYRFLSNALLSRDPSDTRRYVVATHFGPHRQSIAPVWQHDTISAYFINHLPQLVEAADLWLHGHTHYAFDYQVGQDPTRGRVICHPRGYAKGSEKDQAAAYVPRLIEVPVIAQAW